MERNLFLNQEFCAVEEDGRLVEYIPIRDMDQTGKILEGRISRMMPGLDAAFVNIGRKKDGFLPLTENSESFVGIPLQSGDNVMVQIRKEETGSKGAYLSRDLSIAGSFLILMPMNRHIGVSARIRDPKERERLLQQGKKMAEGRFGLVMRESSAKATEKELLQELDYLTDEWKRIQREGTSCNSIEEELIRDYMPRGIQRIIRASELPESLQQQKKEAGNRMIRLPHGGNIVIDRCEAMTVIDVNSASDSGDGNRRATALRTNLEACREIMIQARLRNLAGILILDLIDMEKEEDRYRVQRELENYFQQDRIKTVIHGYTSLGLIEMTRKRSRATWQEQ